MAFSCTFMVLLYFGSSADQHLVKHRTAKPYLFWIVGVGFPAGEEIGDSFDAASKQTQITSFL